MRTALTTPLRLVVVTGLVTVLLTAGAVAATAALAAPKPQTGTWSGTLSQELDLDELHTSKLVFTAYKGRLVGVAARVRMVCDGPNGDAWTDALVSKSWRIGKGPKLSPKGSFAFVVDGVAFQGNLGKVLAEGQIKAQQAECRGEGFWKGKRIEI
jgi:hypothetical protein